MVFDESLVVLLSLISSSFSLFSSWQHEAVSLCCSFHVIRKFCIGKV